MAEVRKQIQKAQHKLMLLYARLTEMMERGQDVTWNNLAGKIPKSECKTHFVFRPRGSPPSQKPLEITNIKDLQDHCALRKPQRGNNLGKLDAVVWKLFPELGKTAVTDDAVTVQVFCTEIGFNVGRGRFIIDYWRASELPTYSAVAQSNAEAETFTEEYGGLYHLYRHDRNKVTAQPDARAGKVVRATLSIRYPVPFKHFDADGAGRSRIRCKLVVPEYGNPDKHGRLEYDGYVGPKGPRDQWHQFLFQARSQNAERDDLILMYTEALTNSARVPSFTRGVMLTQNQDNDSTPTVSSVVIVREPEPRMQRAPGINVDDPRHRYLDDYWALHPNDERDFMVNKAQVFALEADEVRPVVLDLLKGWDELNTQGLHR